MAFKVNFKYNNAMKYRRIAVLSYHTCPLSDIEGGEIGGMNIYVLELCKQLAQRGYVLDIFTRSQDKNNQRIVQVAENLRVIHIIAGRERIFEKKKLSCFIPEFLTNIFNFIAGESAGYDLIYSHYYLSGLIGLQMKKRYKIPLFVTFHTLALMKNLVARDDSEKEDIERVESELLLVRKADKIIATSASDAEYITALYGCPKNILFILTPGIDLSIFCPQDKIKAKQNIGASVNHKLILYVGRIEPIKAIDVLLYSMKILSGSIPQMHLCLWVLGGETNGALNKWPKELKRLDKLRKLLNITTEVVFVGRKHQKELSNYYNASEIVILPSHYESFGLVALEAMSCGIPVITTDTTGIAGIFDKKISSLITSANNPLMLAQKMENLLANNAEYRKIAGEVLQKAKKMSWEIIAEEFVKIAI
jgi:D-inositol-3-phosphate glycosyltransferase